MRYLGVIVLAACGSGDAPATVDAKNGDAGPAARCDPARPFGTPQPLTALNGPTDDMAARLSADELAILFGKIDAASGKWDIYQATRAAPTAEFSAAHVVGPLNSIYDDIWPTETPDGLTLFMATDRVSSMYSIWTAHRSSTSADWNTPAQVATLATTTVDPYVANASSLYVNVNGAIEHVPLTGVNAGMPSPVIGGVNVAMTPSVTRWSRPTSCTSTSAG